ncbi:hypothetical protein AYX15_06429 [Cryptococcus neoformans]|nr:hypothetical protein AYX15_06429 [Cryptococcus neoformans var. grubii]
MSVTASIETTNQHGAEEQFLDLSSFAFPKMYDEQDLFDPFPGFDSSSSAPHPLVATPEVPHSGSPIELFAGHHRSRAGTSIRQYTGLEVAVEEDDYYSEEDLSHENEKEVAYSEDMDWKMDDDMSVTNDHIHNLPQYPSLCISAPRTSTHLYPSTPPSALSELLVSGMDEQHSARYPQLGRSQADLPAKRSNADKKESLTWVRRSIRVRSRNASELQHRQCSIPDSPPNSSSTAASSAESDYTVSSSPEPSRSRGCIKKASTSFKPRLASSSSKVQVAQFERQAKGAIRKKEKGRRASEKRNLQNKNAQKKYRDKKKNLAIRTFDFAVEMTKLGCIIEGKTAKMFRDRVNRYLEDISAMDDNYLKEFMERAEMDCR